MMDVIPILGYILNRGRCPKCHTKISICYPIYEILGGLIFMFTYLYVGFSLEMIIIYVMYSVFFIESISDQKHMIVLDRIWMIGIIPLIVFSNYSR